MLHFRIILGQPCTPRPPPLSVAFFNGYVYVLKPNWNETPTPRPIFWHSVLNLQLPNLLPSCFNTYFFSGPFFFFPLKTFFFSFERKSTFRKDPIMRRSPLDFDFLESYNFIDFSFLCLLLTPKCFFSPTRQFKRT